MEVWYVERRKGIKGEGGRGEREEKTRNGIVFLCEKGKGREREREERLTAGFGDDSGRIGHRAVSFGVAGLYADGVSGV